ncbi:MAG: hypothetical protein ACFFEA_14720 [Candidatus Thorarchaeota archaeon]
MKRLIIPLAIGLVLFSSASVAPRFEANSELLDMSVFALAQDPLGINFASPISGEYLKGNITIKVNATVIVDAKVMLRWSNDHWIDITDRYNATSRLYEYPMDMSCLPTGNVTFVVQQLTSHGTDQSSVEAYVDWERPPILIVDDYYNATVTQYYTNALEALGYHNKTGYDVWRIIDDGSPSEDDLLDYQIVIWYRSNDARTISSSEQNSIQAYLANPSTRKMLLTGTEIAWKAYNDGNYEVWLSTNFGVNDYIRDGSNSETLVGMIAGPYSGVSYTYGGGDGSHAGGGADWVKTMEFSDGVIEYQSSGYDEYAATASPFARGLFFGFAFDAISSSSGRTDLMNRTLSYFGFYEPPQVSVIAPASGDLKKSPLALEWSSSSTIPGGFYNPSYSIYVDGQLNASGLSSETYSVPLAHGNHTIRVVCEDNYGQRGYANVSIECDSIHPQIEAINHGPGSVLKSSTVIDFDLIDDYLESAVARWDSDSWTPLQSPYSTVLPIGDGNHIFHVIAFDAAGNSNYTQFAFTCDDLPPDIALIGIVNGSILMSDTIISLEINDTYFDKAKYHWDLNDETEFTSPFELAMPSGDGIHDLHVNATDIAGNNRFVRYQFIADDTVPVISLEGIVNGTILRTGAPVNLTITDLHFENMVYKWDLTEPVDYGYSDVTLYAPPLEGQHWLFVNVSDEAGNKASALFMFIVDNTAPKITVISPSEGSSIPGGTQVAIDIIELYLDLVHFKWDSGTWSQWNAPFATVSPAGEGYHALFVNATDLAGNEIQAVFVFVIYDVSTTASTTTTSVTTTPTTPLPTGPAIDIPASLGIMGIGIYLGLVIGIFVLPRLKRWKATSS